MAVVWTPEDVQSMLDEYGVTCLWFGARLSASLYQGNILTGGDSIYGFKYDAPQVQTLIRTSVRQRMEYGYEGVLPRGTVKFIIPNVQIVDGEVNPVPMWERVFRGDVIVVKDKPMRDFDVLVRGRRDKVFAFDVQKILYVTSTNAAGEEVQYEYGVDYTLQLNGVDIPGTEQTDGSILLTPPGTIPITSDIVFNWLSGGKEPKDGGQYVVEFTCSPNYVVYDDLANNRATEDGDLPKSVLCVRRAYFNQTPNPVDTVQERNPILGSPDNVIDQDDIDLSMIGGQ